MTKSKKQNITKIIEDTEKKETKIEPKRKIEKLNKVDLSKVGLKLVETKKNTKTPTTKPKTPIKKKAINKKVASWQNQEKKETNNSILVMVETKAKKPKKPTKASPLKK